jgi:Carboxypeptidase regulatory-like domain
MTAKVLISQIKVENPCSVAWDSMIGNDQIRFCEHCNLSVNNLSELTQKQVLRLISKSDGRLCVRYHRRPDGSLVTGTYRFEGLKAASYTLRIEAPGFTPKEVDSVYVPANGETQLQQTLEIERIEAVDELSGGKGSLHNGGRCSIH